MLFISTLMNGSLLTSTSMLLVSVVDLLKHHEKFCTKLFFIFTKLASFMFILDFCIKLLCVLDGSLMFDYMCAYTLLQVSLSSIQTLMEQD